ncbi:MAG: NAD-binding protein [Nitriliruptorales bacterium]|nr:NAD-binding protein [Nitriliruptorales bacterium]
MSTTADLPPPRTVQTVGIVGWGRMGGPIGTFLVRSGWHVVATDPSDQARKALVAIGAEDAASVRGVGERADAVLVVVVDDAQVRSVFSGDDGILAGARAGTVVAICASVRPDTCRDLAAEAAQSGVHVIDVALVGGERGAEQAGLKLYCGGAAAAIDACRRAFAAFAIDVCAIGDVGSGQVAKTVNNLLLWSCLRADVEALRLGRALGVDPGKLRAFLSVGSGANRPLAEWGMHRLRWPGKDMEVALGLAEEAGLDLPMMKTLAPLMNELTVKDLEELR